MALRQEVENLREEVRMSKVFESRSDTEVYNADNFTDSSQD